MYVTLLFVIVLIVVVLAFFEDERIQAQEWLLFTIAIVLTMYVAFRPEGIDNDYYGYLKYYENPNDEMVLMLEPTFKLISAFARYCRESLILFLVYALFAVPLKVYSIKRLSPYWYLSILVWLTHLFLLQDMTQIRVAVSSAFFLFSLPFLADGKKKRFLLCIIMAILFHFSSLVLLPLIFLGNKRLSSIWKFILWALPISMYVFPFLSIELLFMLPIPFIQEKLELYKMIMEGGLWDELNTLNVMALARLFAYYMLLWKYEYLIEKYSYISLLLKIFCYSICVYVGFSFLPVLATRAEELIAVIDCILFPLLAVLIRPHWLGRLLVIVYAIVALGLYIYVYTLLKI